MPLFIDALKEYNKNEIKWTVPKKGTEHYNKVIKIMNDLKKSKQLNPNNPNNPNNPKQQNNPKNKFCFSKYI